MVDPVAKKAIQPLGAAPVREDSPSFTDLGVDPLIVRALADVGIERAFAIQEMAVPVALAGHDLIGQARTGTGKTLGFGIPLLQQVVGPEEGGDGRPQALVVVPTRELAVQVTRDLEVAGKLRQIRCVSIYGGRAYEPQVAALAKGVDVVVGTPGRLLDLAEQGRLRLGKVRVLVLDEADEMLDLGFLPDIERILAIVPEQRQTMLFSATMPGPIVALARRFMHRPTQIRAHAHEDTSTLPPVRQFAYQAHALDKVEMLARILQARDRGLTLVFCRTKRTAAKVAEELARRGFAAAAVHGDLGQGARERALRAFRNGKVDVLVATDVAARGIDIEAITHVINYQCPEDEKVHLHRIGRTARAGATGTAVTFVDWDEVSRWRAICDALDLPFHEAPETYSTSEHLHVDLDIPAAATGTLPRAQRTRAGLSAEDVEDIGETGQSHGRRRTRRASQAATDSSSRRRRVSEPRGDERVSIVGRRPRSGASPEPSNGHRRPKAEERSEAEAEQWAPRRRRTRRGVPVEGEEQSGSADVGQSDSATAPSGEETSTRRRRPRRRRRRPSESARMAE